MEVNSFNEQPLRLGSPLAVVPGQIIGDRYRIGSIIGEGGMGIVCAGTHIALGTPVAIKLIRADLKHDAESVRRFLNEARTAAALKGEHVARVHDVGQLPSGEPYLVMEQLDGMGLDAFIAARGPLSPDEAVEIVLQACEGLAEAHAVALVHRDIKPANLFLARRPDGGSTLKILDFGISKHLRDSAVQGLTDPGKSLGSPSYMSPEQMIDASLVDQRADVWSLGILLFELLTAETPFGSESVPQVCAAVLTSPAPAPSDRRAGIDDELDAIVLRCLEKDPAKRYASVAALAEALAPFAARPAARAGTRTAGSLAPLYAGERHPRSRWSFLAIAAALLSTAGAVAWLSLSRAGRAASPSGWGDAASFRLPWDPVLAAGPEDAVPLARSYAAPPMALQYLTAETSPPDTGLPGSGATASADAALTRAEAERRTERYRTWLRDQGLTEVGDALRGASGSAASGTEAGAVSSDE